MLIHCILRCFILMYFQITSYLLILEVFKALILPVAEEDLQVSEVAEAPSVVVPVVELDNGYN